MVKNIACAFQFLTVFPIPIKTGEVNLKGSLPWFPLAGAVVGLCAGFGYLLLHKTLGFSANVSAALAILIYIVSTRGLHLDGFMDTIDGFFSRKGSETILKIMKEPAIGSFAAAGLGVWFLLLFSTVPTLHPADFVMAHTLTRFQVLLPPLFVSYPRENGTGKFFVQNTTKLTVLFAFVLVTLITAATIWACPELLNRLPIYGGCLVVALLLTIAVAFWARKKIGGITGDVLGFTIESVHMLLFVLIPWAAAFF